MQTLLWNFPNINKGNYHAERYWVDTGFGDELHEIEELHYPSLMENCQIVGARQFTSQQLFQLWRAGAHLLGHSR